MGSRKDLDDNRDKEVNQGEAGVSTDSHTTSWVSAEGTSRSSSGNECALQPDTGKVATFQTLSTQGIAQGGGRLLHALEEAAAETSEHQGMAGAEPDLEEEDEALDAAAALDAMRAPEKSREQREPKRVGLPIEECGPIQTAAEQALFFMVYQDPACKNADGSDNFLVMSGKFNCHYGRQIVARATGQVVAPGDIINMTSSKRLEEFTDSMIRACDIVDALRAKQAASQQEVKVSREHRIEVRRLQRQQAEAQAVASVAPVAPQPILNLGKRKRGGVGVSKKCSACFPKVPAKHSLLTIEIENAKETDARRRPLVGN
ncbi:g4697 [Coccomyxa viridis]|uniref:G4697 protein n=1 Tax=Coccomyxa viridis TaxID=1274662 RepID=A0ABP1FQZ6_9CHLO